MVSKLDSKKIREIEDRYGRPMPEVLISLYDRHGGQVGTAEELGVNQSTVSRWARYFKLRPVLRHGERVRG